MKSRSLCLHTGQVIETDETGGNSFQETHKLLSESVLSVNRSHSFGEYCRKLITRDWILECSTSEGGASMLMKEDWQTKQPVFGK
jgi:hypothetical protein